MSDLDVAKLVFLVGFFGPVLRIYFRILSLGVMGVRLLLCWIPDDEPRHLLAAAHSGL